MTGLYGTNLFPRFAIDHIKMEQIPKPLFKYIFYKHFCDQKLWFVLQVVLLLN